MRQLDIYKKQKKLTLTSLKTKKLTQNGSQEKKIDHRPKSKSLQ